MTHMIKIEAEDGHTLEAAVAGDPDTARGGVVVLQEIFGLNEHIRDLPRRFAEAGYYAVAPAMFDRAEPGVELDYNAAGKERGIALKNAVDADALFDVSAAIRAAAAAGPVSVVGFCWGGSLAWRAAPCLKGIAGAVSDYGGELPSKAGLVAHCPVLAHFGERDQTIPMEGVKTFIKAQVDADPAVISHIYDADHGFNCDARGQFDASAAEMAWERTLAFLDRVSR
ncbi:MAG: dienelactone hydrolase family protein [Pseudomonadota bacterium]|nr:dienelactone hydrolase family protein [Pseudomonadota bacterium]